MSMLDDILRRAVTLVNRVGEAQAPGTELMVTGALVSANGIDTGHYDPRELGADPTGTADSADALATTSSQAVAAGRRMVVTKGRYRIGRSVVLSSEVEFAGGILIPDAGVTVTFSGKVFAPENSCCCDVSQSGAFTFAPGVMSSVSPVNFGAIGDGVSDDLQAFDAALTALMSMGGGTLRVPSPSAAYRVTGPIVVGKSFISCADLLDYTHGVNSEQGSSYVDADRILASALPRIDIVGDNSAIWADYVPGSLDALIYYGLPDNVDRTTATRESSRISGLRLFAQGAYSKTGLDAGFAVAIGDIPDPATLNQIGLVLPGSSGVVVSACEFSGFRAGRCYNDAQRLTDSACKSYRCGFGLVAVRATTLRLEQSHAVAATVIGYQLSGDQITAENITADECSGDFWFLQGQGLTWTGGTLHSTDADFGSSIIFGHAENPSATVSGVHVQSVHGSSVSVAPAIFISKTTNLTFKNCALPRTSPTAYTWQFHDTDSSAIDIDGPITNNDCNPAFHPEKLTKIRSSDFEEPFAGTWEHAAARECTRLIGRPSYIDVLNFGAPVESLFVWNNAWAGNVATVDYNGAFANGGIAIGNGFGGLGTVHGFRIVGPKNNLVSSWMIRARVSLPAAGAHDFAVGFKSPAGTGVSCDILLGKIFSVSSTYFSLKIDTGTATATGIDTAHYLQAGDFELMMRWDRASGQVHFSVNGGTEITVSGALVGTSGLIGNMLGSVYFAAGSGTPAITCALQKLLIAWS